MYKCQIVKLIHILLADEKKERPRQPTSKWRGGDTRGCIRLSKQNTFWGCYIFVLLVDGANPLVDGGVGV